MEIEAKYRMCVTGYNGTANARWWCIECARHTCSIACALNTLQHIYKLHQYNNFTGGNFMLTRAIYIYIHKYIFPSDFNTFLMLHSTHLMIFIHRHTPPTTNNPGNIPMHVYFSFFFLSYVACTYNTMQITPPALHHHPNIHEKLLTIIVFMRWLISMCNLPNRWVCNL